MTTPLTSRLLQRFAGQLRTGRHPLVVGSAGELVLLQGRAVPLADALALQFQSVFDIVLRINAADGVMVLKGESHYDSLAEGEGEPHDDPDRDRQVRAMARAAQRKDPVEVVRTCLSQDRLSAAVIIEQADVFLQDPAHHDLLDRDRIANLQLALRDAASVGRYRNTCTMLAGDVRRVPDVLHADLDDVVLLDVEAPTHDERSEYLNSVIGTMAGGERLSADSRRVIVERLASLTDGESLQHLSSLATFSAASGIPVDDPRALVGSHRFGDRPDYWRALLPRLDECQTILKSKVFGQDAALAKVTEVLAAGALGLRISGDRFSQEGRPRGVLWFAGPTGVGKTELAKAIAEAVFGDAEAYFRLDMATFGQEHSAERLMGAPPGYVGYENGGELTGAVRRRPNQVILLDEIEKAHHRVLDRLLSILDDGRVTDAQGRVTYFGESIIVATTNAGAGQVNELITRTSGSATYDEIATVITDAVRRSFVEINRPELYGRIASGLVAFDALRDPVIDRIAEKVLEDMVFENGPDLLIDVHSAGAMCRAVLQDPKLRSLGGRAVRELLHDKMRQIAAWVAIEGHSEASEINVRFEYERVWVSVDQGTEQLLNPSSGDVTRNTSHMERQEVPA